MRRNVDFAQAELATKIRGKYLRALEDEQFDVLPAQTYIKGFLRTYAEYLGLDGQLYVDEYNSRFVGAADEHEPRTRRSAVRPQRKNHRRIETNVVLIALAAIAVLVVVIISAWTTSDNKPPTTAKKSRPAATRHSRASSALLTLTGLRGSTHVAARVGSASGNVAFDGTISKGDPAVALRGRRLWLQIDSPENLRIQVRGRLVHVPGLQPRVIIVTPTGWRPA
jgi:cytoskeletal protein RodZ